MNGKILKTLKGHKTKILCIKLHLNVSYYIYSFEGEFYEKFPDVIFGRLCYSMGFDFIKEGEDFIC